MGLGDELIAVAEAERLHRNAERKVKIIDSTGKQRFSPVFEKVPWLIQRGESAKGAVSLLNCPGHRPYIDYARSGGSKQVLRSSYTPMRGSFHFTDDELKRAREWMSDREVEPGFVAFDPYVKGTFSGTNKEWPMSGWIRVVGKLRVSQVQTVQMSPGRAPTMFGVSGRVQEEVRMAMAIMSFAGAVLCSEGFLHHAAAALKIPAVVIWGGRSDPNILGYPEHENLYVETEGSPCGSMSRTCDHCTDAMGRIYPEDVLAVIQRVRRAG